MDTTWSEPAHSLSDGVFIGLAFAMGGGLLMETWLFMMHVSQLAQFAGAVPWMSLGILAALRKRRATAGAIGASAEDTMPHAVSSNTGAAIVLLAAGGIIGSLIVAGGATVLILCATACGFMPWQRVLLCKEQPGRASLVMCSGGAIVLGYAHDDVDVMFLPIAAWALGISGLVACTWTMRRQAVSKETAEAGAVPVRP